MGTLRGPDRGHDSGDASGHDTDDASGHGRNREISGNRVRSFLFDSPGWIRAFLAVVARPHLWPIAARQALRIARPRWWARPPFLPVPDADYLRFRLETAYGATIAPRPADLVAYLEWCRALSR